VTALGVVGLIGAVGIVVAFVPVYRHQLKKAESDWVAGVAQFGICRLQEDELYVGGELRRTHRVTSGTRAEVVVSLEKVKGKVKSAIAVLAIDGDDWTESIPVQDVEYMQAVRFAQAVTLTAQRGEAD
jgi:hypothetical protein